MRTKFFRRGMHTKTELFYPSTSTKVTYVLGSHSWMQTLPAGARSWIPSAARRRFDSPLFDGPTVRIVERTNKDRSITRRDYRVESQTGIWHAGMKLAGGFEHLPRRLRTVVKYPNGTLVFYERAPRDDHVKGLEVRSIFRNGLSRSIRPRISRERCEGVCGTSHKFGRARELAERRAALRRP